MLKIFKSRKDREEDINSWVFHPYHGKELDLTLLIQSFGIIIFAWLITSFLSQASIGKWGMILYNTSVVVCGIWLLTSPAVLKVRWWSIGKYWPLVVFPLLALTVVVILIDIYPDPEGVLHRSDILGFCGDFLAFLGTFCLGYFIYAHDRVKETERKREKTYRLLKLVQKATRELNGLAHLAANEKYLKAIKNRERIEPVTYDPDWSEYYFEYESLEGIHLDLYQTLERFFDTVIQVNSAIETGQIESAVKIYKSYRVRESYSLARYNLSEAMLCLRCAYDNVHSVDTDCWSERRENVKLINSYCKQYYCLIENYIYAWLLKHHTDSTVEDEDLRREVTDWLIKNSPEIKKAIWEPRRKRLISRVVYDCSLKFSEKSKRIGYTRGEYFLK